MRIEDPVRHYLPVIQGDELRMYWKIYNDGPNTLILTDVLPSCSAVKLAADYPRLVQVGDSAVLEFRYLSDENINLAEHAIRLYGNMLPKGEAKMLFDVTVVPSSQRRADFEEQLLHRISLRGNESNTRNNSYLTDKYPFDNDEDE